ncbi:hypothetical protein ACS8YF_10555 [Salinisphaera sp. SWV1]|uniref:hypothetical protein n=1 Tax=Salinisphaera sp. SWV1 TaxID=3454139 RepID=UPI003F869BED
MQAFNCDVIVRRPQRVSAPDASLAREAGLRLAKPMRVSRAWVVGPAGDARHPAQRRWVSGCPSMGEETSASPDNAEETRHAAGSR